MLFLIGRNVSVNRITVGAIFSPQCSSYYLQLRTLAHWHPVEGCAVFCRPARTVPRDTGSLSFYTNFAPTTASQKPLANMRIYLVITINHLIVGRCFMSRLAVVPNFEQKE